MHTRRGHNRKAPASATARWGRRPRRRAPDLLVPLPRQEEHPLYVTTNAKRREKKTRRQTVSKRHQSPWKAIDSPRSQRNKQHTRRGQRQTRVIHTTPFPRRLCIECFPRWLLHGARNTHVDDSGPPRRRQRSAGSLLSSLLEELAGHAVRVSLRDAHPLTVGVYNRDDQLRL